MSKEIAHIFWHGELTELEKTSVKSFVKNGFITKLWSYTGLQVDGAESCDARLILPEENLLKYKQRHFENKDSSKYYSSLAAFSDAFRWNVIRKFGGWWFDADCYCLKPESEFAKLRKDAPIIAGLQDHRSPSVNSGVFYANETVSQLLCEELDMLCDAFEYNFDNWGMIGPELISTVIQKNRLTDYIQPIDKFYAIAHSDFNDFIEPEQKIIAKCKIADSYVTHIWHSKLECYNVDKNNPPVNSLLYEFYNDTYVNDQKQNLEMIKVYDSVLQRYVAVSKCYMDILKRPGDQEGIIHYTLSDLPINTIREIFLNSEEYKNTKHIFREDMLTLLPSGECAEIGVFKGEYSAHILEKNDPIKLHLIDVWGNIELSYYDYEMTDDATQNMIFNSIKRKYGKLDNVNIIKSLSTKAAELFKDETLDWVYIDADHSFEGCYNDLVAYNPKVKTDGYICGHDWLPEYFHRDGFGVNTAVLKFVEENNYILSLITDEYEYKSYIISKSENAHNVLMSNIKK